MASLKIAILFLFSLTAHSDDPLDKFGVCKEFRDCVVTQADFCGCGGSGSNTAVSKTKLNQWNSKLKKDGQGYSCLAALSDHWTCTKKVKADCLKNKCVVVEEK